MSEKSLENMADEYAANAKIIAGQIEECRAAIDKARKERRSMRISRLERNLSVLYAQHNELCSIEQHLRNYYEKEEKIAV